MTTEASAGRSGETRRLARGIALLLAGTLLLLSCATHESRRGDRVDVSKYPAEIQAAYEVFATRCSRCHTLARPLNARIDDPKHWIRYVHRMRLQPGSGIDARNGEIILRFLLYYHGSSSKTEAAPAPSAPPAPSGEPQLPPKDNPTDPSAGPQSKAANVATHAEKGRHS
jgi:hypothetical protein